MNERLLPRRRLTDCARARRVRCARGPLGLRLWGREPAARCAREKTLKGDGARGQRKRLSTRSCCFGGGPPVGVLPSPAFGPQIGDRPRGSCRAAASDARGAASQRSRARTPSAPPPPLAVPSPA
ncbi:hypothetical protein AAFF_G00333970 [Aldrovandia affinis]|uniref:Uncharacterized protein n=1 Tax=Aldrovandia affinis TaxID=143900 RepID=A0AAD7R6L9_9TELE|nr:hypothetical protein AAFF_G00333970 [Aldrovandia affinis]